jgi:hypothetical protein
LKVSTRSARKEFLSENLKLWEKIRKDRPLSLLKNNVDKLCLEVSRGVVSLRASGRVSKEEHLIISQEPLEKEWMVVILRGESANLHESVDLVDVQGRYDNVFPKGSKIRRRRTVDQGHEDCWIDSNIVCHDFMSRRAKNLVSRVVKREDTRGGKVARRPGAVHLRRIGGRDRKISRTLKFAG